jgi:PIN domain nuclease of toxin-antitoxin system
MALQTAETISVSTITLYEIGQKVRLGKWPEMAPKVTTLIEIVRSQGGRLLNVSPEISLAAAALDWSHRDPFDRLIAATAIVHNLTLVSADTVFDDLVEHQAWSGRVW